MAFLNPGQINPSPELWRKYVVGAVQGMEKFIAGPLLERVGARISLPEATGPSIQVHQESPLDFLGNKEVDFRRGIGANPQSIGKRRTSWNDSVTLPAYTYGADVDEQEEFAGMPFGSVLERRQLQAYMAGLIDLEGRFADIIFGNTTIPWASTTWANIPSAPGGAAPPWVQLVLDNPATGLPVNALRSLVENVRVNAYGLTPNALILEPKSAQALGQHNQILGATTTGAASTQLRDIQLTNEELCDRLRKLLGIQHVHVMESVRRTNNLGQPTATISYTASGAGLWMGVLGSALPVSVTKGSLSIVGGGLIEVVYKDFEPIMKENEHATGFINYVKTYREYIEVGRQRSTSNPAGSDATNPFGYYVSAVVA